MRAVPNPLPAGQCAGISVEVQDPDGYRTSTLSDGSPLDFHRFQYQSSDLTAFSWKDGNPAEGYICAAATATVAQTTVSVALPDGNAGSAILSALAPGQSAPAFQYPVQAALRPPGVPPTYARQSPAAAVAAAGSSAPALSSANPPIGLVADAPAPWLAFLTLDATTTRAQLLGGGGESAVAVGSGATRHSGSVSVEPIVVAVQPSPTVVSWINAAWTGAGTTKSGSVSVPTLTNTAISYNSYPAGNFAFTNARLISTRISDLSPTTAGGRLTLTLAPDRVSALAGAVTAPGSASQQEISQFSLDAPGLDRSAVMGIASFVVPSSAQDGAFPDLFVTVGGNHAALWAAWYQDFVINGNNGAANEKTFTLRLMSSNLSTVFATVKAYGVGIVALRATRATSEGVTKLVAQLYVKRMEITAGASP